MRWYESRISNGNSINFADLVAAESVPCAGRAQQFPRHSIYLADTIPG